MPRLTRRPRQALMISVTMVSVSPMECRVRRVLTRKPLCPWRARYGLDEIKKGDLGGWKVASGISIRRLSSGPSRYREA